MYVFKKLKEILVYRLLVPCWVILLLLIGFGCACSRFIAGRAVHTDIARTVESIKEANKSARSKITDSQRYVSDAEKHIDRTIDAVGRSKIAAERNAESVDQLQKLIGECQRIVENQQRIIRDVDGRSGERPQGKD